MTEQEKKEQKRQDRICKTLFLAPLFAIWFGIPGYFAFDAVKDKVKSEIEKKQAEKQAEAKKAITYNTALSFVRQK